MVQVATGRINYRGTSEQSVLNVTVKSSSGLGKIFAPTWELVMASKRGEITWAEYTERYYALMRERYAQNKAAFMTVLAMDEVVLTCYCPDTSRTTRHCHRYLLVDILEKIAQKERVAFERLGEVK